MSQTFVMRDRKAQSDKPVFRERVFHGAHSRSGIEVTGHWSTQGPQPVGEGGVPQWVADAFDADPRLMQVALSGEHEGQKFGSVYSRIEHEVSKG